MTSDHSTRFDDLLPAYALGALDGEELRELEAHLAAGCPACAAELRRLAVDMEALAEVAAVLPAAPAGPAMDAAGTAPGAAVPGAAVPGAADSPETREILAGVKRRLLAQVAQEPRVQAPRASQAPAAPAVPAAPEPAAFGRRLRGGRSQADLAGTAARARTWPLLAAAAVLAVVAVWGVVRQASLGAEIERLQGERRQLAARASALERRVNEMQAQSDRLARTLTILAAPNVQSVSLSGMGTSHSAVGRTFIDAAAHHAVFYASNLPALGPDKSYQLWYLDEDEQKTSAGVFSADANGKAALVIDQPLPLERIQGWVVTIEPRGGRPQPTGPMALAG